MGKLSSHMRLYTGLSLAIITLLTSSCATIFTGGYKRISVISDTPGAKFTATQERRETKELKTGETYWMKRNRSATIKIEAPGYLTEQTDIMLSGLHPLFQLDYSLLVPAIVDLATGATHTLTTGVVKRSLVKLPPKVENTVGFRVADMKIQIVEGKTRKERRNTVVPEAENVKTFENESSLTWADTLNHMLHQQGYKVPDYDKSIFTNAYSAKYKLSPVVTRIEVKEVSNNDFVLTSDITWRLLSRSDEVVWSKDLNYSQTFHNYSQKKRNYLFINMQGSLCKLMNEQQTELAKYLIVSENAPLEEEKLSWIDLPKPSAAAKPINKVTKSVVTVVTNDGHGSGSIVSENGYILTNYHVILGAKKMEVSINGELLTATLVRKNEDADLALLKIEKTGLQPIAVVGQDSLEIGTEVYAIGTPSDVSLGQTVTKGIVSAIRNVDNQKIIQTDVAINSGNSGGALVGSTGLLVGIPNAKLNRAEGIGICIPAASAFKRLKLKYAN